MPAWLAVQRVSYRWLTADQVAPASKSLIDQGPLGVLALAALAFFYIAWRREARRADKWETLALHPAEQNSRLLIGAEVAVDVLKQIPRQGNDQ